MSEKKLVFMALQENVGVCKLDARETIPMWAYQGEFFSITKTVDELSIVCPEVVVPENILCEKGWKIINNASLDFLRSIVLFFGKTIFIKYLHLWRISLSFFYKGKNYNYIGLL